MHATTKQLLSLRDREPVAVEVQEHLNECGSCQRELHQLRNVQNALRAMSNVELIDSDNGGASDVMPQWDGPKWESVKQAVKTRNSRQRQRIGQWAIAASVAVFVIAALPFIKTDQQGSDNNLVQNTLTQNNSVQSNAAQDTLAPKNALTAKQKQEQLIARNVQLESALRELPQPPRVMRGDTAYAIASFEDQIALVDYELSYGKEMGVDDARSVSLLQNRADLLGSLYKVRYTQAMASLASY